MRRRWAAALLLSLATTASPASAARLPPAAQPISRLSLDWWKARHEAKLAEARRGRVDLVLLGDSITQDYERTGPEPFHDFSAVWNRYYADRHALNLGFSGDATSHLLWRMRHGELDGLAPKAAVILIGANNLGRLHWPPAETVQGIAAVVEEARRRLPGTKLLLLGVLPSQRSDWASAATREINAALALRYGEGKAPWVTYLDIAPVFMSGNALDTSLYFDPKLSPPEPPLHPSPEGQARMAAAIEPVLHTLLGDRPH